MKQRGKRGSRKITAINGLLSAFLILFVSVGVFLVSYLNPCYDVFKKVNDVARPGFSKAQFRILGLELGFN